MKKVFTLTIIITFVVIHIILPQTPQNNPYYTSQYELFSVNVPELWQYAGYGNSNIVIAVFGMGVNINHPDLNDNIFVNNFEIPNDGIDNDENGYIDDYNGWNTIDNNPNVLPNVDDDIHNHETYIAGIIGAELNYEGIVGVAPHCKILPVKFYHHSSIPNLTQQIAEAFKYVLKLQQQYPAKRFLINLSYGFAPSDLNQQIITPIIDSCYVKGILVFCSPGNRFGDTVKYPANLSSTFSVTELSPGSYKKFDVLGQSNHGPENDFAVPGTMLKATGYNNDYQPFSGTSAAVPVAVGITALFLSIDMNLTPQKIKKY